jgi:hypothetical protein
MSGYTLSGKYRCFHSLQVIERSVPLTGWEEEAGAMHTGMDNAGSTRKYLSRIRNRHTVDVAWKAGHASPICGAGPCSRRIASPVEPTIQARSWRSGAMRPPGSRSRFPGCTVKQRTRDYRGFAEDQDNHVRYAYLSISILLVIGLPSKMSR